MKKGVITTIFFIIFFFPIQSISYGKNIEIRVKSGNVRRGPGLKEGIVGYVNNGEVYKAKDHNKGWYKIELGNKKTTGWVHKTIAKVTNKKPLHRKTVSLSYKNSWALVIGISNYNELPILGYAAEDARLFEDKIKEYGFNKSITLYDNDATKKNIIGTLKDTVAKRVGQDDRLLILFAGRTYTKEQGGKKIGYLAPVDTSGKRIFKDSISIDELRSILKGIPARHILCVIDATISGLGLSARKGPPYYQNSSYLKKAMANAGIQVISAGRDFEPMDPYGARSLFINILLKGLGGNADKNLNGIITGNELGSYLQARVSFESNNKQFPEFGRWGGKGEIVFKALNGTSGTQLLYEMVFVSGGTFEMGSPGRLGRQEEKPLHTVYLNPFYIGKYEVANYQYRQFINTTNHRPPGSWEDPKYNKAKQPVVGITWHDAYAFCRWLGKRLPTEAEWEKAARGTEWQKYPWGGDNPIDKKMQRANIDGIVGHPIPSGKYKTGSSPYGAYDMAGNVWEWVFDWYRGDYYKMSSKDNPAGPSIPEEENAKVLRGGGWNSSDFVSRSSYRNWLNADYSNTDIGFRCAE